MRFSTFSGSSPHVVKIMLDLPQSCRGGSQEPQEHSEGTAWPVLPVQPVMLLVQPMQPVLLLVRIALQAQPVVLLVQPVLLLVRLDQPTQPVVLLAQPLLFIRIRPTLRKRRRRRWILRVERLLGKYLGAPSS